MWLCSKLARASCSSTKISLWYVDEMNKGRTRLSSLNLPSTASRLLFGEDDTSKRQFGGKHTEGEPAADMSLCFAQIEYKYAFVGTDRFILRLLIQQSDILQHPCHDVRSVELRRLILIRRDQGQTEYGMCHYEEFMTPLHFSNHTGSRLTLYKHLGNIFLEISCFCYRR